jgi:glycosyltransferase 2 family protein
MGKALGMIIWSSQTLGMILLGLFSLIFLPRNYKKGEEDAAQQSTE